MNSVFTTLLFLVFVLLLIELSRRPPLQTRDVKVWSDEIERRLIAGLPPQDRR